MRSIRGPSRAIWALVALLALALPLAACGGDEEVSADTPTPGPDTSGATAQHLFVYQDTVWGASGMPEEIRPQKSCVRSSRFMPGEQMGWRIKVYDPATGEDIETEARAQALAGAEEIDPASLVLESVTITLGDGQVFETEYGGHGRPEPQDAFWAYFWEIPEDYPTGVLSYTITATAKDGRVGTYSSDQMNIASAMVQIVEQGLGPAQ